MALLDFIEMSPERTERLIKRVEKWRQEYGVTQKDLAERLGMTPQQFNDVVKGRTQLTGEQALHLEEIISAKVFVGRQRRRGK